METLGGNQRFPTRALRGNKHEALSKSLELIDMDKIYELMKELSKYTKYVEVPINSEIIIKVVVIPEDKYANFVDGLRKLSINSKPQASPSAQSDNMQFYSRLL